MIILMYTFLVISVARYKEYMICMISSNKIFRCITCFDLCASAIGNLWGICLGVNILRPFP